MSGACHSLLDGEAVLLAGLVLLLALHTSPHSVVEVVVARLDHLGYHLKEGVMEGVRSEVVGMVIPVRLAVMMVLLAQGSSQEVNLNYIWNNIFCCKVSEYKSTPFSFRVEFFSFRCCKNSCHNLNQSLLPFFREN